MAETIHTTVALELTGADEAPGVVEGGVLNQETRELNIEALPGDIPDSIVFDVSAPGDERDGHAVRGHRAGGRHAARRPRGDRASPRSPRRRSSRSRTRSRPRPSWSARTASRSSPPRARRGEAGRRRRLRRRPPPTRSPEPAVRLLRARRLAGRRAGEPGSRLRREPAQRGLQGRGGAGAPLGPPEGQEEVRRRADRGPHRPRRPARRGAAAADLHERRRPLGRPRARLLQARPRPSARHPRRDRPRRSATSAPASAAAWPATTA